MKKNILFLMYFLLGLSLSVFAAEKPKVTFIILEENIDKKLTIVVETKLKEIFKAEGFNVVESVFKEDLSDKNFPDNDEKIRSLIKNLNADVVIIGRAVVTGIKDKEGGITSYSVDISANAFKTDDMGVLGTSRDSVTSDSKTGSSELLENTSSNLAKNLSDQILLKWIPNNKD